MSPSQNRERSLRSRGGSSRGTGPDPELLRGIHPVEEALRAGRRSLHRLLIRAGEARRELRAIRELAHEAGVPICESEDPSSEMWGNSQGVLLEAGALPLLSIDDLAAGAEPPRTLVALDGVEDPQNLGAIARVAEASGVAGLVLTRRRAPPLSPAVSRASAGAIEWLPVARVPNLGRALNRLKQKGFWIFGADPLAPEELFSLPDRALAGERVLVLGGEGRGLRPGIASILDHRVRIPMLGRVASLNVSAAAAVLLFELLRRARARV